MVGTDADVESTEIKVVDKSGRISLGKRYAGNTLRMERRRDGSVVLTTVAVVPEAHLWTFQEPDRSRIARGLTSAANTPARETNVDQLEKAAMRPSAARGRR